MKSQTAYEMKCMPSVPDYFWIDGHCGYQAAHGRTPHEAIANLIDAELQVEENRKNGSIGKPAWYPWDGRWNE